MKPCDVEVMLKNHYDDPQFSVFTDTSCYSIGRGCVGYKNHEGPYIKLTKELKCWRIIDNKLQEVNDELGILFDAETYLFQWTFEFVVDDTINEEAIFYYWKGSSASKGFSPLPAEIKNQDPIVERICQWSEPALFFHMFPKSLIVFSGKRDNFNPDVKRLFMVRGELDNEIHLYEIPCLKDSLRSRAIFLLIEPSESKIFYWYGASVLQDQQQLIREKLKLNEYQDSWTHFKKIEITEGQDDIFLKLLGSDGNDYVNIKNTANFTPRLFYFNSITGNFLATEVEYPLRSSKHVAPFPFLQSHLYTATQPALFLLDNETEIWLWRGWKTEEIDLELDRIELELAKKTAIDYSIEKEKGKGFVIPVKQVLAGLEPIDFINIFPYWNKRYDITDLQKKEGHTTNTAFNEK